MHLLGPNPPDTMHPDIGKLSKFLMDSLDSIVYKDDQQGTEIVVLKVMDTDSPFEGCNIVKFCKASKLAESTGVVVNFV